jgi:RNA polymerase sigma-70 factor (ECF subfamily)
MTPGRRRAVLDRLARRYWKPVYHYLRANGHQDAEALDLTQAFFVEVVLGRDLFGQAREQRGRFRSFLLYCLKNFLRDHHRRCRARRRSPDRPLLSIDEWAEADRSKFEPPAQTASPEDIYHRRWAASLIEQVIDRLATVCREAGLDVHFDIFERRFIHPALQQVAPAPLEELALQHRLTPKQAANRAETVRRRFRRLLLDEVRLTVEDENESEDELRSLMSHLRSRVG